MESGVPQFASASPPRTRARRPARASPGALLLQALLLLGLAALAAFIVHNVAINLARLSIHVGFDFLTRPAGFEIATHLIDYSARSTYAAAFVVGVLNTLAVTVVSCVLATILGFAIGLLRLSSNRLVSFVALAYVELVRNVPLLLQLFFWYFAALAALPQPRQSFGFLDLAYLNRRGLYLAALQAEPALSAWVAALVLGIVAWLWLDHFVWRRGAPDARAKQRWIGIAGIAALLIVIGAVFGAPFALDAPRLEGFNFTGGILVIPEFLAMIVGLSVFGAAFIAELVRGGVLAVPRGQMEASLSLGLGTYQTYRRVVVPQAMRIILPPLISQYILILKNSSLGAAIAYPELMLVSGTVLNQTGQPIDIMAITMAIYLALCLGIAAVGNTLNRRLQRVTL